MSQFVYANRSLRVHMVSVADLIHRCSPLKPTDIADSVS